MVELPAVPCEKCGLVDQPEVVVNRLSAECDEYRYECRRCRHLLVAAILGDEETVERVKREREGWGVEVTLDREGAATVEGPFPMGAGGRSA